MQRGIGKHDPQVAIRRRDRFSNRRFRSLSQKDDRASWSGEEIPFEGVDVAVPASRLDIGDHDRQWLGIAMLASPELPYGFAVQRIASQMIATEPLDRDDFAAPERFGDERQPIFHHDFLSARID